jgi:hypothetical protein
MAAYDPRSFEQKRRDEHQRKSGVVAVQEREALAVPVAVAAEIEDPNVFDMEAYKQLVQELGVDDSAIRNYEFRKFLNDEGIEVYPYEKVAAFLDAKLLKEAPKQHLVWVWKPLNSGYPAAPRDRRLPTVLSGLMSFTVTIGGAEYTAQDPSHQSRAYCRAIPQAVLMTVKKIKDRFKDALFYASDYEVRDPDPFLMVTGPGLDYYVIERWDEPAFRS